MQEERTTASSIDPVVPAANVSRADSDALLDAALKAAAASALKGFARSDGAAFLTAEVAINEAWGAGSHGYPTHVRNDYVAGPKVAPLANLPRLMPVTGGYPLLQEGRIAGGIGISGGDHSQDQEVARAALVSVGFKVPA